MRGQFIDLPPDSASLPRQAAGPQLWPMSGLFLLDVYALNRAKDQRKEMYETQIY